MSWRERRGLLFLVALVVAVSVIIGVVLWLVRGGQEAKREARADYATARVDYEASLAKWDGLVERANYLRPDCAVDVGAFPAVCSALSWITDANEGVPRVPGLDSRSLDADRARESEKTLRAAQGEIDGLVGKYVVELDKIEAQIALASKTFRVESLEPELERGRKIITTARDALAGASDDSRAVAEKVKGRVAALQKLIDDVEGRKKDIRITEGRDVITALAHGRARVEDAGKLLATWPGVRPDLKNLQLDTDQNAG